MKSYNELINEIDKEIIKQNSRNQILRKIIKNIKETDCGINQSVFHKEWY